MIEELVLMSVDGLERKRVDLIRRKGEIEKIKKERELGFIRDIETLTEEERNLNWMLGQVNEELYVNRGVSIYESST